MAQLDVMAPSPLEAGYAAPHCTAEGQVRSVLFHPVGYSLWLVPSELPAGSELRWGGRHGDEAVYVLEGAVEAAGAGVQGDGDRCGTGGAIVVEAGAPASLRATAPTRLLHFGPISTEQPDDGLNGPAEAGGHGVHVVGRDSTRHVRYEGHPIDNHFFADCTCPRCRIVLFSVSAGEPHTAASHVHSQDEIIHVLEGELQVGPQTVKAGMAVAIPAGRRYGFRTPGPYRFLNYRRDASTFTGAPGSEPVVEISLG